MTVEISAVGGAGTVSPTSPLGSALLGKKVGDTRRRPGAQGRVARDDRATSTEPVDTLTAAVLARPGLHATLGRWPPAKQRNLGRLSEIAQVAVRHGFGYLDRGPQATDPAAEGTARGRHLREMLDELGPTFVKFGQLLSTRPDVVPPDIIAELRGLQDDVRPFPYADVERTIAGGARPADRAAVHRVRSRSRSRRRRSARCTGRRFRTAGAWWSRCSGRTRRGRSRPIYRCMYQAARLVKERIRALDFIDTSEIVDEFARSIRQELDYRLEAPQRGCVPQGLRRPSSRRGAARLLDATHVRACSRSSTSTACSSPTSSSTRGRSSSAGISRT